MSRIDDSCIDIVKKHGVAWWTGREGLVVKDKLGTRSGDLQPNKCYVSTGMTFIEIFNTHFFNNLATGSFTIGLYVNMPMVANNGVRHILFSKEGDFILYEQNGILFFELANEFVVDTQPSGVDFCDTHTHLVIAWRDATKDMVKIGIEVFSQYRREEVLGVNPFLSSTTNLIIGDSAFPGTKLSGVFFLTGNILELEEKQRYWMDGYIPVNDVVFYQLDETVGQIVFDSSGLEHHGVVRNYLPECWGVVNEGFSWQNKYGYSSGQYVIDVGVSEINIGGMNYSINSDVLVPFENGRPKQDVLTKIGLEHSGRTQINIRIEDILCYKGNGLTYGVVSDSSRLMYDIGTDEFAVFAVFENLSTESGILLRVGDNVKPRYEVGFNSGTPDMLIRTGDTTHMVSVDEGFRRVVLNFTQTHIDVYIDGNFIISLELDINYTQGGMACVFGSTVGGALTVSNIVLLGVRTEQMTSDDRIGFFAEDLSLPVRNDFLTIPCSMTDVLFDVSGTANHIQLMEYISDVWEGRQSVFAYLFGGYIRAYKSVQELGVSSVIPYTQHGEVQAYDTYGEGQFNVKHDWTGGFNMFDCYVNMNPYDVDIGFHTRFWSKDSSDIWAFLNGAYMTGNPYLWHISELTQEALEMSLTQNFWNYAFSGSRLKQPQGIVIEIVDLMLLNLGNNINEKYLPV